MKKVVLENFPMFSGKHLCWSPILIKLQTWTPATLFKRHSSTGAFPWIFAKFLRTPNLKKIGKQLLLNMDSSISLTWKVMGKKVILATNKKLILQLLQMLNPADFKRLCVSRLCLVKINQWSFRFTNFKFLPSYNFRYRSIHQRYSIKKADLKNFFLQYSQEDACVGVSL